MAITNDDDIVQALGAGQRRAVFGSKLITPAHTAGGWHLLAGMAGDPPATTYPGTDLQFKSCSELVGDGTNIFGIQHGGDVSGLGFTKHLSGIGVGVVGAAGAPWGLQIVDLQGYYRLSGANVTGTGSRSLINTNTFTADAGTDLITYANDWNTYTKVQFTTTTTLPAGLSLATDYWLIRASATTAYVASSYANAVAGTYINLTSAGTGTHTLTTRVPRSAVGTEAMLVVQTAPTLGGPNMTASSYTNAVGTSGRGFINNPTMGAAADAYASRILHSGNAAGRYGPFLGKVGGDTGIRSVESFTLSGGTAYGGSGVLAMVLARPLLPRPIPVPATGLITERDLRHHLPSLPIIEPGACLAFVMLATGATTNLSPVTFDIETLWG